MTLSEELTWRGRRVRWGRHAEKLAATIPRAQLWLLEQAGHLVQRDQPVQLATRLQAWLSRQALRGTKEEGRWRTRVDRHGPLSPSALARRAGLHLATLTGVLDRLERGGWVARERDPSDRRAVVVRALRDRYAELLGLYAGMNRSMNQVCAAYGDAELEVIADFLQRTAAAGQAATEELGGD